MATSKKKKIPKKEYPVCRYCGSDDVNCDATAVWNKETQAWELEGTMDGGFCCACEETNSYFTWVEKP